MPAPDPCLWKMQASGISNPQSIRMEKVYWGPVIKPLIFFTCSWAGFLTIQVLNINPIFVCLTLFDYPISKVVNKEMNALSKTDSDFEHRGSKRRSVNIPCALKISGAISLARLLDLSAGGAFVEFKGLLPVCGTKISLIFPIKGQKEVLDLDLKATVVYANRFLQSFATITDLVSELSMFPVRPQPCP